MADEKKCSKCGEIKPLEAFGKEPRVRDGRTARCRSCEPLKQYIEERR